MNAVPVPRASAYLGRAESDRSPYRVREAPPEPFVGANWLSPGLAFTNRHDDARMFRTAGAAHAHAALLEDLRPKARFVVENADGEVVPRDHAAIAEFYTKPSHAITG